MTTPEQQLRDLQHQVTQHQQQMTQQQQLMTQHQQGMAQQQLIIAQQQQQIEQLTRQQTDPTENKTVMHMLPKIAPTKPDTYSGKSTTRGTPADVWLFGLEQYFKATGVALNDEFKINFAAAQLRDTAATWWRRQTQRTYTQSNTGAGISLTSTHPDPPTTWKDFKERFLKHFLPIATKDSARADLHNIRQRNSVAGYCEAFNTILIRLEQEDMSEEDQLFLFKKGLNKDMQKYLLLVRPKTLTEAQALVVRYEAENPFKNTQQYSTYKNNQQTYTRQQGTYSSSSQQGPTPMELGRLQQNEHTSDDEGTDDDEETEESVSALNRRLTPEEIEEYKRQGKCFKCGRHGHLSRNCPTRNTSNTGTRPQAQTKTSKK